MGVANHHVFGETLIIQPSNTKPENLIQKELTGSTLGRQKARSVKKTSTPSHTKP